MDIQMPVMDGMAATKEMRCSDRDAGHSPVPIIALTVNVMQHQVREYLGGMNSVVAKPIQVGELLAVTERLLSSADTQEDVLAGDGPRDLAGPLPLASRRPEPWRLAVLRKSMALLWR